MKKFKRHREYGFFDQDIRLSKLSQLGDPLENLKKGVDFEIFRVLLEDKLTRLPKGKGGRPPYDYVLLFKILILQRYYNLSDDQIEYQINDRMSFMRFLDLTIADDIPDSKTVWKFREQLIELGVILDLFALFNNKLESLGLIAHQGKIVDASFVEVPKQRNSPEENDQIKNSQVPDSFTEKPAKLSQKDTDARWTKKDNKTYFGYKNHIKADATSKIILKYQVTDASVHDSQALDMLLEDRDEGQALYADSAYTGENQEKTVKGKKMVNLVCKKAYRNNPLTKLEKLFNRTPVQNVSLGQ
ncbi:MAG TPA: IS5 family transposase [Sphingobacterium sp.]|nr:IS5 family transposase [Sphingobacterium sp.]